MANIYITREIPEAGLKILREKFGKFEINKKDRVLTQSELLEKVRLRDAVLCLLTDKIDAGVFAAAGPQCKIFSNYAVGYNNIDVEEASRRGIMITNTPGVLTDATADLAIALLFACARRIAEADKFTRAGNFKGWGPMLMIGQDVTGKTLGIVGAGRIGSNVAVKMARGFGMKILYVDKFKNEKLEREIGATQVDMKTLLGESDFVSVHVTLTPETTHMIGGKEFALMKPTCVFINTARGPVVDEKALVKALKDRRIFAAGIDVFEKEPALEPGLIDLPNVIIPPHIASATLWTRSRMAEMAAKNLIDALEGRMPEFCVNKESIKLRTC
ncbi:D-glycerate dehydrogenase [Candidatus Peregrinibacteria bacterium]|nr:D-glycerate dehydrogenase [Candidatus Peregrinibacteria bacterium]